MRRYLFVFILIVAAALSSPAVAAEAPAQTTDAATYETPTNSSQPIKILLKRYEFVPNKIEVKKGVPVNIVFTSQYVTQRIIIKAFKINVAVEKGADTAVSFTPDRSGTFDYFGTAFPGFGHKGLRGKLIVKD
jgi:heme/copper-type cytochrome/quinol oxidase subunit 2